MIADDANVSDAPGDAWNASIETQAGREGVIADDTGPDAADQPQTGVAVAAEAESDDEYERIPARKEKAQRTGSPPRPPQVTRPPRDEKVSHDAVPADGVEGETEAGHQAKGEDQHPTAEVTDDDWLRSRTNRLLDLVDPDDLAAVPAPRTPKEVRQDTASDRDDPHSSGEMTHDVTEDKTVVEEVATDNAVEAISKTSRLFVRNLPFSATEEEIRGAFEEHGTLQEVSGSLCEFSLSSLIQTFAGGKGDML